MDFLEELQTVDFQDLFDRLSAYAGHRLSSADIRLMDGKEPADLVSDLFTKVLTGQRNAETASCTLEEFLFGCLKSDIDAFFRKEKFHWLFLADADGQAHPSEEYLVSETALAKERVINELKNIGADEEEIEVFCIWSEGVTKPDKVATELGLLSSDIYKIQRRLNNHLQKIHNKTKTLV